MNDDAYMTVEQVADFLNLSVGTIYNKVSAGEFPYHKFGAKIIRFKKSEINEWLSAQEEKMLKRKQGLETEMENSAPAIAPDVLEILKQHPIEAPAFLRKQFGK